MQAGVRARQPHKVTPVLHTPGTELKQLPPILHLHWGCTPRMRDEEQGMTAAYLCAPSADESAGGCEVEYKKVKTSQRNPEDRQAGKLYFFQVVCPCVSFSVNPKHYVTLQERKVLNIFRDRYLTVIQGVFRETVTFLSCPQD